MKKLMITLAAVAVAAGLQAATTDWKFNAGTSVLRDGYGEGDSMSGATVYLINADTYSQQDILDAFNGNSFDISSYVMKDNASKAITGTTDGNGKFLAKNSTTFSLDGRTVGTSELNAFSVVISSDANGNYIYLSDAVNPPDVESPNVQTIGPTFLASSDAWGKTTTFGDAGWYTQSAVPEPTSGLLLLLGVAGLALRRRRA